MLTSSVGRERKLDVEKNGYWIVTEEACQGVIERVFDCGKKEVRAEGGVERELGTVGG